MNDIITISFNAAELISVLIPVLLLVGYVWIRIRECKNMEERGFHKKVYNDFDVTTLDTTSAKQAKGFVEASVSEEELENILSPIFTKIMKASNNGNSEVYINGRDWYYRDNIKYKEAGKRLEELGYSIWKGGKTLGVIIKWD